MSLLLKEFIHQVLLEQQISDKDAEAPEGAELGKIAFAPARKNKPFEENTPIENNLYHFLRAYFRNNQPLTSEQCQLLQKFLAQGWYSEIIKEPEVDTIYRGMTVGEGWLVQALNLDDGEEVPNNGVKTISLTFTPKRNSSSWTQSKKIADQFSHSPSTNDYDLILNKKYNVRLFASVIDNPNMFAAGVNGLYNIGYFSAFNDELEVIGLGPIKVFKIEWSMT